MRIGLVACSAGKLSEPAAARDLYSSQLFRKAAAYADATCDRWYILSALHGLVAPDTVLQPYDVRLSTSSRQNAAWRLRVRSQLLVELADESDVQLVALAGVEYRRALQLVPWSVETPMAGLGIGQQLGYLTRELRELAAAA